MSLHHPRDDYERAVRDLVTVLTGPLAVWDTRRGWVERAARALVDARREELAIRDGFAPAAEDVA